VITILSLGMPNAGFVLPGADSSEAVFGVVLQHLVLPDFMHLLGNLTATCSDALLDIAEL
jgi:hypothetical protein